MSVRILKKQIRKVFPKSDKHLRRVCSQSISHRKCTPAPAEFSAERYQLMIHRQHRDKIRTLSADMFCQLYYEAGDLTLFVDNTVCTLQLPELCIADINERQEASRGLHTLKHCRDWSACFTYCYC